MNFLWREKRRKIGCVIIGGLAVLLSQHASSTPFDDWKLTHFSSEQIASGLSADDASAADDGVSNLYKYALGLTPWEDPYSFLPSGGVSGDFLTLEYRLNLLATDIRYVVESSSDLTSWSDESALGQQTELATLGSGVVKILYKDWRSLTAGGSRFLRLKVERPEIPVDADLDGDGMTDAWEFSHFGSIEAGEAAADSDGDGLTNMREFLI